MPVPEGEVASRSLVRDPRGPNDRPARVRLSAACLFDFGLCLAALAFVAQAAGEAAAAAPAIGAKKIFVLLFLMRGPIKILVPFVAMTEEGAGAGLRRRLAGRAVLSSAAALADWSGAACSRTSTSRSRSSP